MMSNQRKAAFIDGQQENGAKQGRTRNEENKTLWIVESTERVDLVPRASASLLQPQTTTHQAHA